MQEIIPFLLYEEEPKVFLVGGTLFRPTQMSGTSKATALFLVWITFCAIVSAIFFAYAGTNIPNSLKVQVMVFFAVLGYIDLVILGAALFNTKTYRERTNDSALKEPHFIIDQNAKTVTFHSASEHRLLGKLDELSISVVRDPWMNKGIGRRSVLAKVGDKTLIIYVTKGHSAGAEERQLIEYLAAHGIKAQHYLAKFIGKPKLE